MDKINVEEIVAKHTDSKEDSLSFFQMEFVKEAIKEIVETVVDKCAEEATTTPPDEDRCKNCYGTSGNVERKSILKVKQMIDYE